VNLKQNETSFIWIKETKLPNHKNFYNPNECCKKMNYVFTGENFQKCTGRKYLSENIAEKIICNEFPQYIGQSQLHKQRSINVLPTYAEMKIYTFAKVLEENCYNAAKMKSSQNPHGF
jgi:hypothetical protein